MCLGGRGKRGVMKRQCIWKFLKTILMVLIGSYNVPCFTTDTKHGMLTGLFRVVLQ